MHSERVRFMTERKEKRRKDDLVRSREAKEMSLDRAIKEREMSMTLKKELRAINREEREANVERMMR